MWIYTFQGERQVASSATSYQYERDMDFPGDPVAKHVPANAGGTGLIPGPGRSHQIEVESISSGLSKILRQE